MTTPITFLSALALLLAAPSVVISPSVSEGEAQSIPAAEAEGSETANAAPEKPSPALGFRSNDPAATAVRILDGARRPTDQNQVRIERRIVIRVSPAGRSQREEALSALPRRPIATSFAEVAHQDCVSVDNIVGFHAIGDDRLLLFLRDRRVLSAALERTCSARNFYSGFYVERSGDGKLCVARDRLQSRSGASCQVATLRQLVAVHD